MSDFRELRVWQKAHKLGLSIYRATAQFPREEMYGLTGQMRRAALSIPSNIAEGCGRSGDAELVRFLRIAQGSASELDYQLEVARDLAYLDSAAFEALSSELHEVRRMLSTLMQRLQLSHD
jgi:four helix bundle protein